MQTADLLLTADWIVPIEPCGEALPNHALVVDAGRIVALLPAAEARRSFAAREVVERPGHVVLPGLVNAHTHAAMSLFRGLADDLPLDVWLRQYIWPAEARWADSDFVRDGTELALLEMLRGGTTCFNDMYFFPDVVAALAAEHHLRATVAMIVIEQPTLYASSTEEYLSKGIELHDQFRGHPLVRTAFGPHAPYTVSEPTLARIRVLADELDVPIHIHLQETAGEVAESLERFGRRPLERLAELGLVNPLLLAVHMTQVADTDLELLAARGAHVIHCPESNMKLASGFCPLARLLEHGVNVALGTDGASSNNDLDMFGEMRSAALLGKAVAGSPAVATAEQVLEMATLGGARALGLADEIGSLVPGKAADLICVDLRRAATQPVHHPISQLVYSACREQVADVWVAGQRLLAEHQPLGFDPEAVNARAAAWQRRLKHGED